MTAMTELTDNTVLPGSAEPESLAAAIKDETSLVEAFENTLEISQVCDDAGETDCAASVDSDGTERLEETDTQQDVQMASSPAAESCSAESKWVVGAQCWTVWSEDGQLYPAKVVSVDGQRCRVRFNGYGNEEEVELSALQSQDVMQSQQKSQDWKPGSRCRAVYSEDGLVYPAVVLWVKGQRCRVRFDDYNNEEEHDLRGLLNPGDLHGPIRTPAAKGGSWKSSATSSNSDWKRRRREENQSERGGGGGGGERRSVWRDDQQKSSWQVKDKLGHQSKVEKEAEEKRGAEKPTNPSFPFFPPFPPPQSSSGDPVSFIPPPPPAVWTFGGKEFEGLNATSNMLMLWYMCGFHTGSYLAQQEFRSSTNH